MATIEPMTREEIRIAATNDLNAQAEDIRNDLFCLCENKARAMSALRRDKVCSELRLEQRRIIGQLKQLQAFSPSKAAPIASLQDNDRWKGFWEPAETLRREINTLGEDGLRQLLFAVTYPAGTTCPRCGVNGLTRLTQCLSVRCVACGKHTSLLRGTPLERPYVPLTSWFSMCWVRAFASNTTARSLSALLHVKRQATARRLRHQLARFCTSSVLAHERLTLRIFAQMLLGQQAAQKASTVGEEDNGIA